MLLGLRFPLLMTKPLMLDLIIQVRTTCVCASCPMCCFRNSKSNALVLPFSKILEDLRCLWEWFWSGSDHLVNHFEPGTKLSRGEIHKPKWMEQGNKSKYWVFFFSGFFWGGFFFVAFRLHSCVLLNPLVHQFYCGSPPGWPQCFYMLASMISTADEKAKLKVHISPFFTPSFHSRSVWV